MLIILVVNIRKYNRIKEQNKKELRLACLRITKMFRTKLCKYVSIFKGNLYGFVTNKNFVYNLNIFCFSFHSLFNF
jgi:hypothetical protein